MKKRDVDSFFSSPSRGEGRVRGRTRGNGAKGFTLVEVLIGLALSAIVMSAIYSLYLIFYKQSSCQYLKLEAQQNSRAALEMIQKELLMAGYRVASGTASIATASATSLTFRYVDPDDGNNIEITYGISGTTLTKVKCVRTGNWTDPCSTTFPDTADTVQLMGNLKANGLAFNYFEADGDVTADTGSIRFVKITIEAEAREKCAGQTAKDSVKVWTEVRLRNLETESGQADTTEPDAVASLKVREAVTSAGRARVCGRLTLRFTKSTAEDLASYKIMYRLNAADSVERSVTVSKTSSELTEPVAGTLQYTLSPTDGATGEWFLQSTKSNELASPKTYIMGIRAVDTSNNASTLTEISGGNPDPSNTDFASEPDDSTINPSRPQGAAGFTAALTGVDGSSDGWVDLSWTYDTAANPDVIGYRVYRSTSNFAAYPIAAGGIAAETDVYGAANKLIASSATYTDKSPGLVGCQTYYYAITPVNCDDTLVAGNTSSDYKVTYGDGVATATVDSPLNNVSDTAPPDTVGIGGRTGDTSPYPYPALSAAAGWKRVKLNLTNPNITGIHNPPASYSDPDFNHTYIAFKRWPSGAGVCDSATACVVNCCYPGNISNTGVLTDPDGAGVAAPPAVSISLLPDHDPSVAQAGKFTDAGSGGDNSFFFDSETQLSATPPTLENVCATFADPNNPCTYYFKAISFDRCGNASNITAFAQPLSTLCGDDPDYPGSPGVPTGLTVGGCTSAQLSWNDTLSSIIDFAGYTVERDIDADVSGATALSGKTFYALPEGDVYWYDQYWPNSASCPWGCGKPYWEDSALTQGVDYYYFIRSMDCAYANDPLGDSTDPADGIYIDFPGNISGAAWAGPKSFGKIDRDSKCEDTVLPVDRACGNNDLSNKHREVLMGVEINTGAGNGNGTSSPKPWTSGGIDFTNHSVTLFLNNTSNRSMTITGAAVGWVNDDAYLRNITIGGGRSSGATISNAVPASRAVAAAPQSYATTVTLGAPVTIAALDRYVPITFEFKDSSGNPVNMRGDEIKVSLTVTNDSTLTATCGSFLTVSEAEESVNVPGGPAVTSTQQNKPVSGTNSYAVPGSTGLNTVPAVLMTTEGPVVDGGLVVGVSADIASNTVSQDTLSRISISSGKLYYAVTSYAVTEPPATMASYTEVSMTQSDLLTPCSGFTSTTRCYADIPAQNGQRVWYFVRAIDADGNFDISPEPVVVGGVLKANAYVYDQKAADKCLVTPKSPTNLVVSSVVGAATPWTVTFTWSAVTQYTSGADIFAGDSITYKVYKSTGALVCTAIAPDTTCFYSEPIQGVYYYNVKAENTCAAPGPMVSAASTSCTGCVGPSGAASVTVSPLSIVVGQSYTVTVQDCLAASSGHELHLDTVNIAVPAAPAVNDLGAGPGTFTNKSYNNTADANAQVSVISTYAPELTETGLATTTFGPITVTTATDLSANVKATPASGDNDVIDVRYAFAAFDSTKHRITVASDACADIPAAPATLTVTAQSNPSVTLGWTASTAWDAAGYELEEKICHKLGCASGVEVDWPGTVRTYLHPTATATFGPTGSNYNLKTYCWRIRTYDTCGTPNYSAYRPNDTVGVCETR